MRHLTLTLTTLLFACSLAIPAYSQTADTKTPPKNYAQKLVDEAMAKYSDVVIWLYTPRRQTIQITRLSRGVVQPAVKSVLARKRTRMICAS